MQKQIRILSCYCHHSNSEANSKDPDEMPHDVKFNKDLHCLLRLKQFSAIKLFLTLCILMHYSFWFNTKTWDNPLYISRGVRLFFSKKKNCIILSEYLYSLDPDEIQHYAAFHLGLHCLQSYSFRGFPIQRVNLEKFLPMTPLL